MLSAHAHGCCTIVTTTPIVPTPLHQLHQLRRQRQQQRRPSLDPKVTAEQPTFQIDFNDKTGPFSGPRPKRVHVRRALVRASWDFLFRQRGFKMNDGHVGKQFHRVRFRQMPVFVVPPGSF